MSLSETDLPSAPAFMAAMMPRRPPGLLLPACSLCHRELVRFLRQRHRVVGALATPIVFWLLIGLGMGRSFSSASGESYIQFFFPGTLLMILLFTAVFSTISIIEDRREGFLQGVLVSPAPRSAVVLGKVLGGTILAVGQGLIFLALAPVVGFPFSPASVVCTLAQMTLLSLGLTSLGLCIAWPMGSTQGFHAIMNLFLMPLWFLSGALFPASGAMGPMAWLMRLNPLTYGLEGLRQSLRLGLPATHPSHGPALFPCMVVTAGLALGLFLLARWIAGRTPAAEGT